MSRDTTPAFPVTVCVVRLVREPARTSWSNRHGRIGTLNARLCAYRFTRAQLGFDTTTGVDGWEK